MIYTLLLAIFLGWSSCGAMQKNLHEIVLVIETEDHQKVPVPLSFIQFAKTLRDMLEDFKDNPQNVIEVPISHLKSEPLKQAIDLANSFEKKEAIDKSLLNFEIEELAWLLRTLNYLDCRALLFDVLRALGDKLYRSFQTPAHSDLIASTFSNLTCDEIIAKIKAGYAIPSELWNLLEEILPEDLQKLLQKYLLLNCAILKDFMKAETLETQQTFHPARSAIRGGCFLQLTDEYANFVLYDLSKSPIKVIGYFRKGGTHSMSDDGKYLFYSEPVSLYAKSILMNLDEGKTVKFYRMTAYFSPDSRFLMTNKGEVFDLLRWCNAPELSSRITPEMLPTHIDQGQRGMVQNTFGIKCSRFWPLSKEKKIEEYFAHPEFKKLKNQDDIDTFCSQLPEFLLGPGIRFQMSDNAEHAAFLVEMNTRGAKARRFFLYDTADIHNIKLEAADSGVKGFLVHNNEVVVAKSDEIKCYNFKNKTYLTRASNLEILSLAWSDDPHSFFTVCTSRSNKELTVIKGWFFEESINTYYTIDFITGYAQRPGYRDSIVYDAQSSKLVTSGLLNNQKYILPLLDTMHLRDFPLKRLMGDYSLKDLLSYITVKSSIEQPGKNDQNSEVENTRKRKQDDKDINDRHLKRYRSE